MGNVTVTDVAANGASAPLVRITGGTPFWLGGFHVDSDLRRRVSCWRPVWVGGICQASPGMYARTAGRQFSMTLSWECKRPGLDKGFQGDELYWVS
jgi:hypothetical protein